MPTQGHPAVGFVVMTSVPFAMQVSPSFIGTRTAPFDVVVDASSVRKFCHAIRHELVYRGSSGEASSLLVPATFPMTFHAPTTPAWLVGLSDGALLAGQQAFEYQRPLRCGERLSCYVMLLNLEDKATRRGPAQILTQELRAVDESEEPVVTNRRVFVYLPPSEVAA